MNRYLICCIFKSLHMWLSCIDVAQVITCIHIKPTLCVITRYVIAHSYAHSSVIKVNIPMMYRTMCAYTHALVQQCIHQSLHLSLLYTYMNQIIHSFVHMFIHSFMYTCMHTGVTLFIHICAQLNNLYLCACAQYCMFLVIDSSNHDAKHICERAHTHMCTHICNHTHNHAHMCVHAHTNAHAF